MTTPTSRRQFLKQSALLLAGCGAGLLGGTDWSLPAEAKGYKIADWTGDDFTVGHKLRDGKIPRFPTSPERKVDFVIVGGGISGLAAAYHLRNHDTLLLEQYNEAGGHARGGSHNGIGYSYGAAYIAVVEGAVGDLLHELNLNPVELDETKNSWYLNDKWLRSATGGNEHKFFEELKRFRNENKTFWGGWDGTYSKTLLDNADLMKMDGEPFENFFKSYDPTFAALMDSVLRSGVNGGVGSLSTLAGLATLEDVFEKTYLLSGGNPAVSRELVKKLQQANSKLLQTGAFTWSVQLKDNGANVVYSMPDGSMHMVECKHVIMAAPLMVAMRIMKGVADKAKATMMRFRYGSYLVANLMMKKRTFDGAYDNWVASPYEIADITLAETPYMMANQYKPEMGSVWTIYIPYDLASTGRTLLYQGNKRKFATSIVSQLEKLFPGVTKNIDQIVLSRWGHSMAICKPQYFKYLNDLHTFQTNSFSFAHSSAHGLPGIEAATAGAKFAADRALAAKAQAQRLHSIEGIRTSWS